MKGILIDPFSMTVSEVEHDGSVEGICRLLECNIFTLAVFSDNDDGVYVDDEGLLVSDQAFFSIEGYPQPLAGKGLVLGCDADGKSTSPKHSFEEIRSMVRFHGQIEGSVL